MQSMDFFQSFFIKNLTDKYYFTSSETRLLPLSVLLAQALLYMDNTCRKCQAGMEFEAWID